MGRFGDCGLFRDICDLAYFISEFELYIVDEGDKVVLYCVAVGLVGVRDLGFQDLHLLYVLEGF